MAQVGKDSSGGSFSFAGLAALVLVAVGIIVQQLPLEPTRPTPSHVLRESYPSLQRIPARLWEDPFEAVAADRNAARSAQSGSAGPARHVNAADLAMRIKDRTVQAGATCISILPVTLPGGSFSEYAEVRRRTRYAVVSALLRSGYVAEDEDHIGVLQLRRWEDPETTGLPNTVPFESYVRDDTRSEGKFDTGQCTDRRRALVLWLDEDSFAAAPIAKLNQVLRRLNESGKEIDRVKLIGPSGSKLLEDMLGEVFYTPPVNDPCPDAVGDPSKPLWQYCAPLEIYAWGATTPASQFQLALDDTYMRMLFKRQHITLLRPNVDDRKVIQRLIPELALRDVKLGRDAIAVIGESDTAYGRQLVRLIGEEAKRQGLDTTKGCHDADDGTRGQGLLRHFNYMRGLDGETAHTARKELRGERPKDQKGSSGERESSSGLPHLDYAVRIAAEVRKCHDRLREHGGRIAAIGILGTDFYDKSLLLQALKKEMPQALYFTTDIDARMTDANQTRWSRNLLVVSGFGLSLHEDLQKQTAPFRDSYQSAAYLSTLLALNVSIDHSDPFRRQIDRGDRNAEAAERAIAVGLMPRAYEIGRHHIFDFGPHPPLAATRPDTKVSGPCTLEALLSCAKLYPAPSDYVQLNGAKNISYAVLMIAALCGLIVSTTWFVRRMIGALCGFAHNGGVRLALLVVFLLASAAAFLIWVPALEREPFRWLEGISAWPSLLLRLIAVALAMCFIGALIEDQLHMEDVLVDFCMPQASQKPVRHWRPEWMLKVHGMLRRKPYQPETPMSIYQWLKDDASSNEAPFHVLARRIVTEYLALATYERRFDRVIPAFLCYMLFGIMAIWLWDSPNVPIRGVGTTNFHFVVLFAYIVCYGLLLFAVVDAVRLFEALVSKLMQAGTVYCPETIERFRKELGLPDWPEIERYLSDWIDIEFIARQTKSTIRLVYYPFVILAVGIVARSQIFDNWYTPVSLGVIFVLGGVYIAFATIRLRTTAEDARRKAVDSMTTQLIALRAHPEMNGPVEKQLETMLERVKAEQRGAFMSLAQQPLWKAVLLPLSGFGGIEVLQYLWLMQP